MREFLLPAQTHIKPRSLALSGIGGVGKTQTALESVYQSKTEFDIIFWAAADTLLKLNQAFASFGSALGLAIGVTGW
ncbi:hypothetical protein B0T16DRAFT_336836 [Cercophora newfieldiana]|uniref:NB-ARC domain-containing protein n=1 Tax=Cercophora newfieldiana TaxID=92897 RepID=A0AA40CIB0_9PEZI|nr:hypothetical protein B0T16DRAFT_336836 [Cercophora newfieldiana]